MISKKESIRISKLLSYVLRHNPSHIGVVLDQNGWLNVDTLLANLQAHQEHLSFDDLKHIVDTNSKKRFSFNKDFTLIRASQGHSVEIELGYVSQMPPVILFHGTTQESIAGIREKGLLKKDRHHVHLSTNKETALEVGKRYGTPRVLSVQSLAMHKAGHLFYLSDNGVWLTDQVPPEFIDP